MTRFKLLMSEAFRSIGANKSTTLAAAVTVLVGMFLLGVFIGLGTWLVSWSDSKKKELAVHVFIKDGAPAKDQNQLRILLESNPLVKTAGHLHLEGSGDRHHAQACAGADLEPRHEPAPCVLRRRPESR